MYGRKGVERNDSLTLLIPRWWDRCFNKRKWWIISLLLVLSDLKLNSKVIDSLSVLLIMSDWFAFCALRHEWLICSLCYFFMYRLLCFSYCEFICAGLSSFYRDTLTVILVIKRLQCIYWCGKLLSIFCHFLEVCKKYTLPLYVNNIHFHLYDNMIYSVLC